MVGVGTAIKFYLKNIIEFLNYLFKELHFQFVDVSHPS